MLPLLTLKHGETIMNYLLNKMKIMKKKGNWPVSVRDWEEDSKTPTNLTL